MTSVNENVLALVTLPADLGSLIIGGIERISGTARAGQGAWCAVVLQLSKDKISQSLKHTELQKSELFISARAHQGGVQHE